MRARRARRLIRLSKAFDGGKQPDSHGVTHGSSLFPNYSRDTGSNTSYLALSAVTGRDLLVRTIRSAARSSQRAKRTRKLSRLLRLGKSFSCLEEIK
jgi:hypothetical protein